MLKEDLCCFIQIEVVEFIVKNYKFLLKILSF